jgi:hypothetical protein
MRRVVSREYQESQEVALARDGSETKGESPMDSQKIYLLAELTVLPEFLDDVKAALKQGCAT